MLETLIQHLSPKTLAVALALFYAVIKLAAWRVEERRICALGGHAPSETSYIPFGQY